MSLRQVDLPDGLNAELFAVIKELRPHLDLQEFKRLVTLANAADGYRLVISEDAGRIVGVIGYRILHDLVDGSHLYVDDLVTTRANRSRGVGAELLKFVEAESRRLGFQTMRLCARLVNLDGQRFYEREGWEKISYSFRKKVPSH